MNKRIAFNRATRDFDMYLNDRYVGSRATHHGAQAELDRLAMAELTHPHAEGRVELMDRLYRLERQVA